MQVVNADADVKQRELHRRLGKQPPLIRHNNINNNDGRGKRKRETKDEKEEKTQLLCSAK